MLQSAAECGRVWQSAAAPLERSSGALHIVRANAYVLVGPRSGGRLRTADDGQKSLLLRTVHTPSIDSSTLRVLSGQHPPVLTKNALTNATNRSDAL